MRTSLLIRIAACTIALLASLAGRTADAQAPVTPKEARAIAKEAYIYGNPMVDSYRILYGSFVDRKNPEYKGPWDQIHNIPRVYTPRDRTVQTPNSDTPYSWLGLDLRAEPYVLTVPPIGKKRYFSIQLVDLYLLLCLATISDIAFSISLVIFLASEPVDLNRIILPTPDIVSTEVL